MSWETSVNQYGGIIEERLRLFFKDQITKAQTYHPLMAEVIKKLEQYILRKGKRLASASVLLTYKGYREAIDDQILQVCMAMELYRHCILIHDDIVDADESRRGGPTLHISYGAKHDDRFGLGTALFTGNIAFSLALQAILEAKLPPDQVQRVLLLFSRGFQAVNESQILDLSFEYTQPTTSEWGTMAAKRAASLFSVALVTGATLAGADAQEQKLLAEAATHMGYAFDIQDDIIDTFAQEREYGKPPGRDISLGKKPLHIICALTSENRELCRTVRSLLGNKSIGPEEMTMIREVIIKSGGLETAKDLSRHHASQAQTLLHQTHLSPDIKAFFDALISYIVNSLEWYK